MGVHIPDLHLRYQQEEQQVTQLDLSRLDLDQFSHFPVSIVKMPRLRKLSLRGNHLQYLPEEILGMSQLVELDLSNNHLSQVPSLQEMHQLQRLDLQGNEIQSLAMLPPSLKSLNLRDNQLHQIPVTLRELPLTHLNLAQNLLQEIHGDQLTETLQYLNLRSNQITQLPQNLNHLDKLVLYNNPLQESHLNFDGTLLTDTHQQFKGSRVLVPRVKDVRASPYYPPQFGLSHAAIPFTSIMIYGDPEVGKQSLIDTYLGEIFLPNEKLSIIQNRYQNWDHYIYMQYKRYFQVWYPNNQDPTDPSYRSGVMNGFYYASMFLLVFDLNRISTLQEVLTAARRIASFRTYHTPIMVLGNKNDLKGLPDREQVEKILKQLEQVLGRRLEYFETSTRDRDSIEKVFDRIYEIYSS